MEIYLYNTLTHEKEKFKPINPNEVKMYSCGPTVYSYAHIGNMRAYIFADTLKRMLEYNGLKVNHVMNITDVGHLTSDADTGEDKMEKAARSEGRDPYEIAAYYTKYFMDDIKSLNIEIPTTITKATDNITQMEEMVKEIVDNGYGYETSKGIYFDITKLEKYPVLSNNKLSGQEAGARIEVDPEKRNPADFALWIKAPKEHLMKWESPWGLSYPGWHIECSAMSKRFLGENFDIHTGGVDHIPVHHENEIAQCKGAFGHNPANFWMHVEFLLIDNGKMSKSLKNIYRISDLQEKGIEALAYRLFCFSAHYRIKLNFTFKGAKSAQISLNKLRKLYILNKNSDTKIDNNILVEAENKFNEAVNDDLNLPLAMGIVWDLLKNETKSKQIAELIIKFDKILGLDLINSEKYQTEERIEIPEEIELLTKQRIEAKQNKDYKRADELRTEVINRGYNIKDLPENKYEITKI